MNQTHRNEPCPCGSGKKFKKCCMGARPGTINSGKISILIAVGAIFLLSLSLRYFGFLQPHGLTFDEGLYSELIAPQLMKDPLNYSTQEAYRYQVSIGQKVPAYLDTPIFKHPPLYNYAIASVYKIFGIGRLQAVSVSIIFGSLTVLLVFLLGRKLYDERVGLIAAFLLCIDPVHWICSEKIWMETAMVFFMVLTLYYFVAGQKQKMLILASGASMGLAMLTKYPSILILFIIVTYACFYERRLIKQKDIWLLGGVAFTVFLPWLIWVIKAHGGLVNGLVGVHGLGKDIERAFNSMQGHGLTVFLVIVLMIGGLYLKKRMPDNAPPKSKAFAIMAGAVLFLIIPVGRAMVYEAFAWKETIIVGWSNILNLNLGWTFYFRRLCELAPLHLVGLLSVVLLFGKNRGDKLLALGIVWIMVAFTLLGNYQSRYILPVIPFLVLLTSRTLILVYDKLIPQGGGKGLVLKTGAAAILGYFLIKTIRTDLLLAIGPDFGYF